MSSYLSDDDLALLKADHPEIIAGDCPTCHGKGGYTFKAVEVPCDCPEQKRLFIRYLHAGIGLTYQRLTWDDLEVPIDQLEPVLKYLDKADAYVEQGIGLLLTGPPGTGKTMLANLVLKELVKRDLACYATTFPQTIEAFTAGWSNVDDKHRFATRFMHNRVLLLDDLGKEFWRSNRLQQTTFDYILRTRVQHARPTILTTNMTSDELRGGYGAAVLSLLVEKSIEVLLKGTDYRVQAHNRTLDEISRGWMRPIA